MKKKVAILTVLAMILGIIYFGGIATAGTAELTFYYGDVALESSGDTQADHFPQVWDLTACDMVISFTYDANGLVDDVGGNAHAWAELGVRTVGYNDFNPTWMAEGAGVWLATDYDWAVNTFDPDPAGSPNLDLDDKLILQKGGGMGEGAYNQPSTPPNPGANHRVWFDRDGVDQWQAQNPLAVDGGTYNTGGTYEVVILLQAIDHTSGTAYMSINGLDQGFETDGNWNTMELTPAGMTFTGDMTQMQVFYGLYGYGTTHSVEFRDIEVTGCMVLEEGMVTGGGWFESPNGAFMFMPENNYFLETFDTDPPLSDTAAEGYWYPDRYPPAAFESTLFDGGNRLHVFISADDYLPYGSTFYNWQGRKFDLGNGVNTHITADLYIGVDWETNDRHASLWATTYDADGIISGYPIIGFTAGTGFRIWTQDLDQNVDNGYQYGWYDVGFPGGFQYGAWYTLRAELTETAYRYYINGELVWTDIVTFDSILWANLMLQAYNYGEDYHVYWDNVGAGSLTGKATFGFISKYKRGADTPTGQTEFNFKAGDLNFHSNSYDWLVIADAKAMYKGVGTIQGWEGEYKFMLTAIDADMNENDSHDVDRFRIKIWYEDAQGEHVVYDNGLGDDSDDATTEISGGSIVIHKPKK